MTAWLDRILGRVTMYALVIISLLVLVIAALIGSLIGQISYPAVDILVSGAVLVVATWALAPDALHADGLATALFFDPSPELLTTEGVSYVRMFANGRVDHSPLFPGELFT